MRRLRRWTHEIGRFYWGSGLCDDVPALAWQLVITLVPLALGLGALATVIFSKGAVRDFADKAADVFPKEVQGQVVALVLDTRKHTPLLIALAVVVMVWTGSGAMGVIERCLSRLLHRDRGDAVRRKLRHLGLAAGLVVVIGANVVVVTETTHLRTTLGLDGWVTSAIGLPAIGLITVAVCTVLYRLAPRGALPWRAAFAGGLPAGLVLLLTPTVVRYYMTEVAGGSAIGVFLVLIGVLVTCYAAAVALIVGAGVAARVVLGRPLPDVQPAPA
ncbi:MAG TPA: YihY/virulence factor BrkB family protein [Solirubrobacteraceae bacterium]|nr:YihY/virulence factor BrkB family protein [Solirubrobacteraceae bacterium]